MLARFSALLVLSVAILAGVAFVWPRPWVAWLEARSPTVRFDADVDRPLVAVTVDDGPSESTFEILEVLARHDAEATFFLIGDRSLRYADAVRQIVEGGHEIGHHMWRDETTALLDEAEFDRRFRWTEHVLETHVPDLVWFRPGGGFYHTRMVERVEREGYRLVLGSAPPLDVVMPSPGVVARHLLAQVRPGAILVIHDGPGRGARTAETLRELLPALDERGYRAVTLSELVAAETGSVRPIGAEATGDR